MMRLKDIAEVKTNFPDADFWLQRKGSIETVGKPTKTFSPENIGIKVVRTDVVDPNYLKYVFDYLFNSGAFKPLAKGTLNLQHLPLNAIRNANIGN